MDSKSTVTVSVTCVDPSQVQADLLFVPAFEGERVPDGHALDSAAGGELRRAHEAAEFTGKAYECFVTPVRAQGWAPGRIALIGAGKRREFDTSRARNVGSAAATAARERRAGRIAFLMESITGVPSLWIGGADAVAGVQGFVEGLVLGEYVGGRHKTVDRPTPSVTDAGIVLPIAADALVPACRDAARRGATLGGCSNLARELAAEPGGVLTPRVFADRAAGLLAGCGVTMEVLDEQAMAALGMRLLLGVAQGSHEPPRLLVLRYEPADSPPAPVLGLVGKGITFDAGGISMKPALGMERMKDDMTGGAAVVCAMRAVGLLSGPMKVVGVVPCAENMPGGGAIRPGDVLTSAGGKTIEVVDTDAEGRLVLADALWYAKRLGATHLVDVATLTGACQIALGKITSGLMGVPDWWVERVRDVASRAGDRSWILPLFEDYREQLHSDVADLANVGGRPAGAITAAMFLREFAGDLPWAHMDIAGTAWRDEAVPFAPKGPTGVGVRTLAELALAPF